METGVIAMELARIMGPEDWLSLYVPLVLFCVVVACVLTYWEGR